MLRLGRRLAVTATLAFLGGCGTYVPYMSEIVDAPEGHLEAGGALEKNIKIQVYCELKAAVLAVTSPESPYYMAIFRKGLYSPALPDDWGVELTLTLQVEEGSSANPSAVWTASPSLAVGASATASSTATRIDKFTSFYLVGDLRTNLGKTDRCFYDQKTGERRDFQAAGSSLLIHSDLRMLEWLHGALHVETNYKSEQDDPSKKGDVYSYNVKFLVVTSGSANPAWKLVRVSTNQGGPSLLQASRSRTHELLATFGPTEKSKGGTRTLTTAASNSHLASEIGSAVANNIRGAVIPTP